MWEPYQLAKWLHDNLSTSAKGIGRSQPPTAPYVNITLTSSEYEGEDGVISASITQRQTRLSLMVVVAVNAKDVNPYEELDTIIGRIISEVNAMPRPSEAKIVDVWAEGTTDYAQGETDTKQQFVAATLGVAVRHR